MQLFSNSLLTGPLADLIGLSKPGKRSSAAPLGYLGALVIGIGLWGIWYYKYIGAIREHYS